MNILNFFRQKAAKPTPIDPKTVESMVVAALERSLIGKPVIMQDKAKEYVDQGYATNADVYAIISRIAQRSSAIPLGLFEVVDKKAFKAYKACLSGTSEDKIKAFKYQMKALKEIESHQILEVIKNPNKMQGEAEFREEAIGYKLLTGNSYLYGGKPEGGPNKGKIISLEVLPAHFMDIVPGDTFNPVKEYQQTFGAKLKFKPENILHMKYWNPFAEEGQRLYGMSPLKAARLIMMQSNNGQIRNAATLESGGHRGLITPETEDDSFTMTQAKDIKAMVTKPATKAGEITVTDARVKWQQIGMSPVDLDIINSLQINRRQLCNIYKMPSQMLNDGENSTYSNMQEARKAFITDAVLPELEAFVDGLNRWMVAEYNRAENTNYYIGYDLNSIPELQDDLEKLVAQLKDADWLTYNEKRLVQGYEAHKHPLADELFVSMNKVPMSQLEDSSDISEEVKALKQQGVNDYE
jgi:HK97 family phage portal protein